MLIGRVLSPNTWGMHSYVMKIIVKNSILLIIEAAIDFLDVPLFPSNDFNPLMQNTTFSGGGNILPGKSDGREIGIPKK